MSSSSRITSNFNKLARLILNSPAGVPRGGPKVPEGGGPPGGFLVKDAFRRKGAIPGGHPTLGGQERAPLRKVAELVPPGLKKVVGQEELGLRFGSDAALLAQHLKPSQLSSSERATRLWEFFAAYAEAAVAQPPQKEGQEAFRESLKGQGFAELRDARTGQDGVTQGLWVLTAKTPDEARERVATVQLEPPPEVRHSEAAVRGEGVAEGGLAVQPRAPDTLRGGPAPLGLQASESEGSDEQPSDSDGRRRSSGKRLGPQMFWNVLHRFRSDPEDGAVAQGQWDRAAFGAMLALVGIALVVLALVSL
ncbi:Immediate early protein ICP0 [Corallococcus terminator]